MSGKTAGVPVLVNGERYAGVKAAAERAGFLLNRKVSPCWVSWVIKDLVSTTEGGVTVSAAPPVPPEPAGKTAGPPSRPPLLRYPRGEAPVDRGICPVPR